MGGGIGDDEVPGFLKQVAKIYPRRKLHLVLDNCATPQTPSLTAWLVGTLASSCTLHSGLKVVEIFIGIITR
jgi:hypothetical protein